MGKEGRKARWIKADGSESELAPAKRRFTLQEMQKAVGGYIEYVGLSHSGADLVMVVNEDGLPLKLPENTVASAIACRRIVGDVLVAPRSLVKG